MSSAATSPVKQKKTFLERQPYLLAYGFGISVFSPTASLYQLVKLNPSVKLSPRDGVKMAMSILPHQTALKLIQMNLSTPVRENLNPWAAFCVVGMLQGGVYGQANIFFATQLNLGKKLSYAGLFRGFGFAGARDMCSQGIPYVLGPKFRTEIVDAYIPSKKEDVILENIKKWASVFTTSIIGTYVSQGLHNCQITMHADQSLNHLQALQKAFAQNGVSLLYKGAEARVGLLIVVNILNELFLKKAWE